MPNCANKIGMKLIAAAVWTMLGPCLAFCQCAVPPEIKAELERKYGGWMIVTSDKLKKDDLHTWKAMHSRECPGVLEGRFADDKQSFAVALVQQEAGKTREQVLLLEEQRGGLKPRVLVPPTEVGVVNVLVKEPPGRYSSFDQSQTIKATTDCIVVVQLEARGLLFYWDGVEFKSLQWSY